MRLRKEGSSAGLQHGGGGAGLGDPVLATPPLAIVRTPDWAGEGADGRHPQDEAQPGAGQPGLASTEATRVRAPFAAWHGDRAWGTPVTADFLPPRIFDRVHLSLSSPLNRDKRKVFITRQTEPWGESRHL